MKIKIISCLIFGMIFSNVARSQEAQLKNIVDIELKGAKKIDVTQGKKSKLGRNKHSIIGRTEQNVGEVYELNGMLLLINGANGDFKKDHLEDIDKTFKEMSEWRPGDPDNSKIEAFGQYRVLTIDYEFDDTETGRYSFFVQSKNNKKVLNGVLEYELTDKAKASEVIEKFIKGIKFK